MHPSKVIEGQRKRKALLPKLIRGDQVRLKQVLINLIKNALKFSPMKNICLKVAYHYETEELIVHVIDGGKGIREGELEKIFTLFSKVLRTVDINEEGIGMGLNICQKILQSCQGHIEVYSEGENKGSTFMFSMKMDLVDKNDQDSSGTLDSCPSIESNNLEESLTLDQNSSYSSQLAIVPVTPVKPVIEEELAVHDGQDLENWTARQSCDAPETYTNRYRSFKIQSEQKQGLGQELYQESDLSVDFGDLVADQILYNGAVDTPSPGRADPILDF